MKRTVRQEDDPIAPRAAAWREWQQRCALHLCAPQSVTLLKAFGKERFNRYWKRCGVPGCRPVDGAHAWHLLETWAQAGRGRGGKVYKRWLMARSSPSAGPADRLAAIESGASCLMREAVRDHVRREYSAPFMESLQRPRSTRGNDGATYTLEELIPSGADPVREVASREINRLAEPLVEWLLHDADRRTQIACWARASGRALNDPQCLAWAGCAKTALYQSYQRQVDRLCCRVRRCYPGEEPATWLALARICLGKAATRIFLTIIAEKSEAHDLIGKRGPAVGTVSEVPVMNAALTDTGACP